MMIEKKQSTTELNISLSGRLDTTTAPWLETELNASLPGMESLVLDFTNLEYVSSAGLRVILAAQKIMNKQGTMVIRNVNDAIAEVFEMTGFAAMLTFE